MSDSMSLPLVTIEIDGQTIQAPQGSMIMEAADQAKVYIPRFCYHEKLSIAANCRMCLVEVEKSRKPLPACATPITEGMKILTRSAMALEAQRAVMQFLLINHPLDCPICDQGGECELQDLSLGFGRDSSDFTEVKRSVADVDIGPLISTNMTRCIHCTRCIRFGSEIAGIKELGLVNRGENAEVTTYIENSLHSELSGNVIDLCPVGALTSKPFRYQARSWELMQKPALGLHDGVGSHLYYHTRRNKIFRAVPRQEEQINEIWLSDRDRFSCHGLYNNRIEKPMVRYSDQWETCDWSQAFYQLSTQIKQLKSAHSSSNKFGAGYINPSASLEEMYLFNNILTNLGIDQFKFNLHQAGEKFSITAGLPYKISALEEMESFVLLGSNLVFEQPILGAKVRKAVQNNAIALAINPLDYDFHFNLAYKSIVTPDKMHEELVALLKAILEQKPQLDPTQEYSNRLKQMPNAPDLLHQHMAKALLQRAKGTIILGAHVQQHPNASRLYELAKILASLTGYSLAYLPHGANVVAAEKVFEDSSNSFAPVNIVFLYDLDPALDVYHSTKLLEQLKEADYVVAFSSFYSETLSQYANVILPIAAFPENSGTWINLEGQWLSQIAAAPTIGDARPGWKVLRVLANCLNFSGYDYMAVEEIAEEAKKHIQENEGNLTSKKLSEFSVALTEQNNTSNAQPAENELFLITEWPIYRIDSLLRNSDPLQLTPINWLPAIYLHPSKMEQFGFEEKEVIEIKQGDTYAVLPVYSNERVPASGALIPASYQETAKIAGLSGCVKVGKA